MHFNIVHQVEYISTNAIHSLDWGGSMAVLSKRCTDYLIQLQTSSINYTVIKCCVYRENSVSHTVHIYYTFTNVS